MNVKIGLSGVGARRPSTDPTKFVRKIVSAARCHLGGFCHFRGIFNFIYLKKKKIQIF